MWVCKNCLELTSEVFDICWNCQHKKKESGVDFGHAADKDRDASKAAEQLRRQQEWKDYTLVKKILISSGMVLGSIVGIVALEYLLNLVGLTFLPIDLLRRAFDFF